MKVTYDKDADAAYMYVKGSIKKGEVKNTMSMNDNIVLGFDSNKKLIGIEILSASTVMPKKVVDVMETA